MRHRLRFAFAAVPLLALAGCLKAPPVMNPSTVKAPAIPLPPPLDDKSQLGYLRAHQVVRLADRVGAGPLVHMGAARGIDLRALDPERPLVVLVGDPAGGGWEKVPLAALLPIAPGGQMAQMITAVAGPDSVSQLAGNVAVALNRPPIDAAHGGPLLETLSRAPLATDVEIYVHVAALMARYGDQLRKGIAGMKDEMRKQSSAREQKIDASIADGYFDWIEQTIDKLRSVTFAVGASESAIDFGAIAEDKTAAPRPLSSTAQSMADLARFVPPGDLRIEARVKDMGRWMDSVFKIYDTVLKDDPQTLAELKDALRRWSRGTSQIAISISPDAERMFTASYVTLADNAAERLEAVRKLAELWNRPGFAKVGEQTGLAVTTKIQRAARMIEGWPVDHLAFELKPTGTNKAMNDIARFLSRPMEIDYMRVGSYLVYQVNGTPDSFDRMVRDLLAGKGQHPSLLARTDHPAGGFLYADLDVPHLMSSIEALMPQKERRDWPHLDETIPHVTFFGFDAASVSWFRSAVPTRLVNAIRALADRGSKKSGGAYLPQPKE
jgi:hypothetical protein